MSSVDERLEAFSRQVHYNLVFGTFADAELPAVNDAGENPVVPVLADEMLRDFLIRIRNAGGYANVFVDMGDHVVFLAVVRDECAIDQAESEDMTGDERPSMDASVGLFVEYLLHTPNGVRLPLGNEPNSRGWPTARVANEHADFAAA